MITDPFVTYEPEEGARTRSRCDHTYGHADALADGRRPSVVPVLQRPGQLADKRGGNTARLGEPLSAEHTACLAHPRFDLTVIGSGGSAGRPTPPHPAA